MSATDKQPWKCVACGKTFAPSIAPSMGSCAGGRQKYWCAECATTGDDHELADWWKRGEQFQAEGFPAATDGRPERSVPLRERTEDSELLRGITLDVNGVGIDSQATKKWLADQSTEAERDRPRSGELPRGGAAGQETDAVHDSLSRIECAILRIAIAIARVLIGLYRLLGKLIRQALGFSSEKPKEK